MKSAITQTDRKREPYEINEEAAKELIQGEQPYEIKPITFEQIARNAPFLDGREDLREQAENGRDTWDYVERKGLHPILRKNGGFAAIWMPSKRGDGSFAWHAVVAVPVRKESLFRFIQVSGFLTAALVDTEQLWLFQMRNPPNNLPWQEIMLEDYSIMPIISVYPHNPVHRLHVTPLAFLAWLLTLPTITLYPAELDKMIETPDGTPPQHDLIVNRGNWWKWNVGSFTPKLGAQWLVARRSGGAQTAIHWMRFIPQGCDPKALIFDRIFDPDKDSEPRFIEKHPPKPEDIQTGYNEISSLGSAKEKKAKKPRKKAIKEPANENKHDDAMDAEFVEVPAKKGN